MVDIQSATADNGRGKKEDETSAAEMAALLGGHKQQGNNIIRNRLS